MGSPSWTFPRRGRGRGKRCFWGGDGHTEGHTAGGIRCRQGRGSLWQRGAITGEKPCVFLPAAAVSQREEEEKPAFGCCREPHRALFSSFYPPPRRTDPLAVQIAQWSITEEDHFLHKRTRPSLCSALLIWRFCVHVIAGNKLSKFIFEMLLL